MWEHASRLGRVRVVGMPRWCADHIPPLGDLALKPRAADLRHGAGFCLEVGGKLQPYVAHRGQVPLIQGAAEQKAFDQRLQRKADHGRSGQHDFRVGSGG